MVEHEFTYTGEIRGQGRPRFRQFGGVYKAKADVEYERAIREAYINSGGENFGDTPIVMRIDVYRALPKTKPRYIVSEPDTVKPDATNIAKSVEDALNGIAYDDDKQLVCVTCFKHDRERVVEHMDVLIRRYGK